MKAAICLLVVMLPLCAEARPVENWPYERLMEESDLVVIGKVESVEDFDGEIEIRQFAEFLTPQATTFKVDGVLRGEHDGETLELVHCRIGDLGGGTLWDWPTLAYFESEGRTISAGAERNPNPFPIQLPQPSYLMFLTEREDGRYEPVAGQVESALSFLKVTSVFGF